MSKVCQYHAIVRTSEVPPAPIIRLRDPEPVTEPCGDCAAVQAGLAEAIADLNADELEGSLAAACGSCGTVYKLRTLVLRDVVARTDTETGTIEYFIGI
jgi:hypothetical protein